MSKLFFKISFLILLAFISIGCTPFFISDSKPKTIQDDGNILVEQKEISLNKIKGFKNITQGVIWDICSRGKNIVLLREDIIDPDTETEGEMTNNLALYNLKEEKIQSITSSSINLFLSRFDADEEGIYYLENKSESIFQLYWFDIPNNKKVKISSTDHQVNPNFYVKSNNEVYYGTKDGKIIRANRSNILTTIDVGSEYYIQQVYCYEDEDLVIFSAFRDGDLNLYSVTPKGKNFTKLLSKINGSFNVSEREDKILYTTPIPDSNKTTLWLFELDKKEAVKLLEGYPQKAVFSPKGDKIAYLDKPDSNTDLHNIWILNMKDQEKEQVASNLKITSEIIWHPRDNKLFFSAYETKDNQLHSTVYSLDFEN